MITQTLNRKTSPPFGKTEKINIIHPEEKQLDNGIPVYTISAGVQDIVKIEFIFPAGRWQEPFPLVSYAANSMLNEGTKAMNADQIADAVDFYGAYFHSESSFDSASITLYSLNKYVENTLPVFRDILTGSVFPEFQLETFRQNNKQRLMVNYEKVDYVADKKFKEIIFGKMHPYGHSVSPSDYDFLNREMLLDFYNQTYTSANCRIIVSGKVEDNMHTLLNKFFGDRWGGATEVKKGNYFDTSEPVSSKEKKHFIPKNDAVQAAIRMGKPLFNKTHPDYCGLIVLNTIFGGYFGSRLMNNIREDKGYTYGIGSSVSSLLHGGYLIISTEVGVDVRSKAVDEIYLEIERLRTEPVPAAELQLVQNYLMGTFLRSIDGPFSLADRFKGIMLYGIGYEYYDNFFETIKSATPEMLNNLANKYLEPGSFCELLVGGRANAS